MTSEADPDEEEQTTFDIESILGLFRAQGAPGRMLHWHYRSRHESLIAVSNQEFYDNKLIIFPSPDRDRADAGLRFHYLPDTTYDRSNSRTNRGEAAAVAAAVMRHVRQTPELTLGVAAFSMAQREAISDEIEHLRRKDRDAEAFFTDHPAEPFFIKNLENVQGDERDVILISIGYGKSTGGKLTMSFGPLNQQGGERRLNVLISRARLRCEVFSNITAGDLQVDATSPFGVRALKLFLDYAQNGVLTTQTPAYREPDSPFEIAVRDRLIAAGHQVAIQVGTAGYFVDLAIIDPVRPGRYILGIECDGATYHSAKSARDRDRLRQEVLENLGWRIHRIWSTDWFRDPAREIRRIGETLEALRLHAECASEPAIANDQEAGDPSASASDAAIMDTPDTRAFARSTSDLSNNGHAQGGAEYSHSRLGYRERGATSSLPRYVTTKLDVSALDYELHTVPYQNLLPYVVRVVETEGPVHVDEVSRRIIEALGVQRRGNRIQEAFLQTFALGVRHGRLRQVGEFLWSPAMIEPVLRDRTFASNSTHKLEMIAPEEIALAVIRVVESSYGMEPADLPAATCRLFGFQRVSEDMRLRVEGVVNTLIKEGRLTRRSAYLIVS